MGPNFVDSVEVQLGRYQKNISQEWSRVKHLSCVSCAAWNVFFVNLLMAVIRRATYNCYKSVTKHTYSRSGLIAGFLSNRFLKGFFLRSKTFATDKKNILCQIKENDLHVSAQSSLVGCPIESKMSTLYKPETS